MNPYSARIALLGSIIDYAGTFPPAALSLSAALARAATFRRESKQPWLMNKVALPLSEITKLTQDQLFKNGADGSPWLFTALGSAVTDPDQYCAKVEWDLREIRRCNQRGLDAPCRVAIVAYESKPPLEELEKANGGEVLDLIAPALDRLITVVGSRLDPYFEISLEGEWKARLDAVVSALVDWTESEPEAGIIPGIKVRTGGNLVPSVEQLAVVIRAITRSGLRFKATQGLHHAVTREASIGFVNLFAALTLAQALGEEKFSTEEIAACLGETDKRHFELGENHFAWRAHRLELEKIEGARRKHAGVFGSCSVDEPDESLQREFPLAEKGI